MLQCAHNMTKEKRFETLQEAPLNLMCNQSNNSVKAEK